MSWFPARLFDPAEESNENREARAKLDIHTHHGSSDPSSHLNDRYLMVVGLSHLRL